MLIIFISSMLVYNNTLKDINTTMIPNNNTVVGVKVNRYFNSVDTDNKRTVYTFGGHNIDERLRTGMTFQNGVSVN